jgi:riboflavin synthase alpha subunit
MGTAGKGAKSGDSIAVAGVCLTLVAAPKAGKGEFDVVRETLDLTTLGSLVPGDEVNLESALRMGDPLGGHMVQGHVDGVGEVRNLRGRDGNVTLSVRAPGEVRKWLVHKGSITVDGVSLTVAKVDRDGFTAALVPHTLEITTLGSLKQGSRVNLEADLVGKWVQRLLEESSAKQRPRAQ